jgi:hypothetical protein
MRLSRDPALWLGLVAAIIQLTAAFVFPLTGEQQAVLNACAVAVAGVITAVWVRRDGQAAAIVGFAQAAIAVGLGFGLNISPEGQAAIMAAVSTAAAMFVRTQVVAAVDSVGGPTVR